LAAQGHTGAAIQLPRFRRAGRVSDYNAFGTLGRFGFFKGGFIKGRFAQLSHAVLYRRHQLSLHGPARAALLWLAERINALVQPPIRIS
jgi:NADH:ubiquinone reductase (H+-translocating)